MKAIPIKTKIGLWVAGFVSFVLAVFAVGTLMNLYKEQIHAVDVELGAIGESIVSMDAREFEQRSLREVVEHKPLWMIATFDRNGGVLRRSPELPEEIARIAINAKRPQTLQHQSDKWRVQSRALPSSTVVIAYHLGDVHAVVEHLLIAYLFSFPIVLILAGLGGWWIAGHALISVRELTTAAESVSPERLDQRVPVPPANDEIQRLSLVLNAMLARLQTSFQQAQRFAADASHELRTPLTIMQGEIERLLATSELQPGQEDKLVSIQEEVQRLNRIAEHLLLLARFDSGAATLNRTPLDFSQLVRQACEDAELLADSRGVSITAQVATGVEVLGDETLLRRLLLNLLDNASAYNRAEGAVQCVLRKEGNSVLFSVGNTGPGIPATMRARLFERFFRGDVSRESSRSHGLGLSLCREIARAHGGDIRLSEEASTDWTEFILNLPAQTTETLRPHAAVLS